MFRPDAFPLLWADSKSTFLQYDDPGSTDSKR